MARMLLKPSDESDTSQDMKNQFDVPPSCRIVSLNSPIHINRPKNMRLLPQSPPSGGLPRPAHWSRAMLAVSLASLASISGILADTITWNFGTTAINASPSSTAIPNLAVAPLTTGNNFGTVAAPFTTASASSGYPGATGQHNAGAAAKIGALDTTASTGSAYFEFTLTPQNGATVSVSQIDFGTRSTSTGPQAFAIRSSVDAYATSLATGTIANNSSWGSAIKSSAVTVAATTAPVTFRIYGYSGAGSPGSGTINWRIDDLTITAAVVGGSTDTLTLTLSPNTIKETGSPSASTATVTRSGTPPFASDLTVAIAITGTTATAPTTVLLPLATGSASFTVTAVDDSLADGDETATITVSAPAFISDAEVITVQNDGDTPPLVINEIQGNPVNPTSGGLPIDNNGDGVFDLSQDEFVELVNVSGANLDISGWTLSDNAQVRHTFVPGTIVLVGQAVVVFGGGTVPPSIGNALAFRSTTSQLGLNNTGGDLVTIRDSSSTFITSAGYSADISTQPASFNMSPEKTFGSPYVLHTAVSGAVGNASPGRKVDGLEFISLDPLTMSISVASISENGGTATGTVTRPGSTAAALPVVISSTNIAKATVSTPIEIPIGAVSADFTITGVDNIEPDGTVAVTIRASGLGFAPAQANIDVVSDTDPIPAATLAPGSIAFTVFNADGGDDFGFVALVPIPAGTEIRFTDNEWNGQPLATTGVFNTGEGFLKWTAPAGDVPAGTVVIINGASSVAPYASNVLDPFSGTPYGTVTGTVNLNVSLETLYAYQGTELYASGFLAAIASHAGDSVVGTDLSASQVVYLPTGARIGAYKGARSTQSSFAGYLALIDDTATNWDAQTALVSQSTDTSTDGVTPDAPFNYDVFSLLVAGNTYGDWATANSAAGGAGGDHDNDGVKNGVEYFFGATGSTFTPNPQPNAAGLISFPHPVATPGTTYRVETSPDLVTWTPVTSTESGGFVNYTIPSGLGKVFVRLNVVTP